MNFTIAGSLRCYFETLYDLNRNLIKCCGADIFDDAIEYDRLLQKIIEDIPKLLPYIRDKNTKELKISHRDGLLEFSDDFPYLEGEYQKALDDHREFLGKVKEVRNKLEHQMHNVKYFSSGSSTITLFEITYTVDNHEVTLYAPDFIRFVKQLNVLYGQIQKEVSTFAWKSKVDTHAYYERLNRYQFYDFNKIYDSDLLVVFGKTLYSF